MGLLRTLLIFFIVFYIIRLFTRYILPSIFSNYMDKKVDEFTQARKKQQKQQEQARRREGEVTIDYSPDGSKNKPAKGEYVDYVEVKD